MSTHNDVAVQLTSSACLFVWDVDEFNAAAGKCVSVSYRLANWAANICSWWWHCRLHHSPCARYGHSCSVVMFIVLRRLWTFILRDLFVKVKCKTASCLLWCAVLTRLATLQSAVYVNNSSNSCKPLPTSSIQKPFWVPRDTVSSMCNRQKPLVW